MLTHTFSAILVGLQPIKVEIEVNTNRGIPGLVFIGLASKIVAESKERITASLRQCGIHVKSKRTIINLAPADLPKTAAHLELGIAIALLKEYGEIKLNTDDVFWCGELSLDGKLKAVKGALPLALGARQLGFKHVVMPAANKDELCDIIGIQIHTTQHLQDCLYWLKQKKLPAVVSSRPIEFNKKPNLKMLAAIQGQTVAKRALMIAAAGGHNVLLIGPPGVGKSILAQSLPELLPPLTYSEILEVTSIHSVANQNHQGLIAARPFRAPHHSLTRTSLLGGGREQLPGEISLAHRGVLFLDEFLECSRTVLEALRQPLESHTVVLSHAGRNTTYPAAFSLILASNPCRCGYAGSSKKTCRCSPRELAEYQRRLSGPLNDRIDLFVRVHDEENTHQHAKENWSEVIITVAQARQRQQHYLSNTKYLTIADVQFEDLATYCPLNTQTSKILELATKQLHLSHRAVHRVTKVAKTIADLEKQDHIQAHHLAEALQFRGT